MTRTAQDVESAFTSETNRLIAERFPIGGVAFIFVFAVAWLLEHLSFPQRNLVYAIVYGLQVLVIGIAVLLLRRARWRSHAQDVAVLSALLISALVGAYYVIVQAQTDVMTMALLYISIGAMVSFPWGWERQLLLSAMTVATLIVANTMGARTVSSLPLHLLGLSTIGALTASGAAYLQQQRLALLRQAAELRTANHALEQANRALADANRTKNEFLANVSHELRTPLNIILGYADLLSDGELGPLDGEVKDTVDRIGRTCRTLVFLISDLLDLSRIEAGHLEVRVQRVELGTLFEDMRRFIEPRLAGRDVVFRTAVENGLCVTADRDRLEQILINLLSNAAKFTTHGSIRLSAKRDGTDGQVQIEVADTGVGIDDQEAATLFEPFRQGAAGKLAGGVGIGLSLSARLATAMRGGLTLRSKLGSGSTFTLRLPA